MYSLVMGDDKRARACADLGVVVATQNPMDVDYRALSNAGFWAGRALYRPMPIRARRRQLGPRQRPGSLAASSAIARSDCDVPERLNVT